MTARNLALEALKEMLEYAGIIEERCDAVATDKARKAISALEAETGEPAAWIDPRDLAVLTCPGVKEFGPMRYAGVSGAQNSKATTPLYTAPLSAVPPGWKQVPVEPTQQMIRAYDPSGSMAGASWGKRQWLAMIAAAPEAPK